MKINSDTPAIEKNLRFLEKTILDHGGYMDPDLLIECKDGELSVSKPSLSDPRHPLIALPQDLLLPTEKMGLTVRNDEIESHPEKDALTETQLKLTDSMLDLYNLTHKIKNHRKTSCWFAFRQSPKSLKKLLKARTLNENKKKFLTFVTSAKTEKGTNENKILCDTYIKTRTIGHQKKNEEEADDEMMMTTNIMPIIDFINHNYAGGYFNFKATEEDKKSKYAFLRLNDNRPLPDSNECFAYYNQMDALDSFINYGFPDSYAPYVRSIPMEFEIPKTGKVVVHALGTKWHQGKLNVNLASLRPYIPQTIKNTKETLEISHLLIPTDKTIQNALRRVLRLVISNKVAVTRSLSPDEVWKCVLDAEEKIIKENIAFYQNLLTEFKDSAENDATGMLRMVTNLQLTKLYKYSFDKSYYTNSTQTNSKHSAAAL